MIRAWSAHERGGETSRRRVVTVGMRGLEGGLTGRALAMRILFTLILMLSVSLVSASQADEAAIREIQARWDDAGIGTTSRP
jgi:hypothetical protein